ncbi:MAG: flavin reductase family protein [Gordonia sp. (in: high G+C Gram-positive bacteria)]
MTAPPLDSTHTDPAHADSAVEPAAALRRIFGEFPSGVVVVAATGPAGPVGLIASSFTSVSLDPPLVSVNVARTSTTLPRLRSLESWGVSVLADRQYDVADLLRRPAETRFDGLAWRATHDGAIHLDDAAAHFTTRLHSLVPAGDHFIALLSIDHHATTADSEPLVFHRSRFRRLQEY